MSIWAVGLTGYNCGNTVTALAGLPGRDVTVSHQAATFAWRSASASFSYITASGHAYTYRAGTLSLLVAGSGT